MIPMQYADDCGYAIISKDQHIMKHTAVTIPSKLKKRNLICNESKNEDYIVTRNGSKEYQKCKYLGTMLDTNTDFKRRKILATTSMSNFKHVWESKHLPLRIKMRIFNACVAPVMLAGSELGNDHLISGGGHLFRSAVELFFSQYSKSPLFFFLIIGPVLFFSAAS